jgi:hypothetical protein
MAAFNAWQSPPLVNIPILFIVGSSVFYISLFSLAFAVTMQNCLRSANTYFYFNTFIFI